MLNFFKIPSFHSSQKKQTTKTPRLKVLHSTLRIEDSSLKIHSPTAHRRLFTISPFHPIPRPLPLESGAIFVLKLDLFQIRSILLALSAGDGENSIPSD
jgi:hypothetical protein